MKHPKSQQAFLFDPWTEPVHQAGGKTAYQADGNTFDPQLDATRLGKQAEAVLALMRDGVWRTLAEIAASVPGSEAGISARLRDFRKEQFGGHRVDRRRRGEASNGLFEYKLTIKD